ncbi:MAG TPA: SdrD B-like domain-containing protein [Gaiellales bacterium]
MLVLLLAMSGLLAVPALASAHPDLSLLKVVNHAQASPGDQLTYTIHIVNHGTHATEGTSVVTDALPAHTTFVSASAGCTAAAGVVTCQITNLLAIGETLDLTVTVTVDADAPAGDLVNTADVTTPNEPSIDTSDNHGTATTSVGFAGLGDYVWWDQNHDGLQTPGEPGFAGVTVNLLDGSGMVVATTTTDATGLYRFDHLHPNATYSVCIAAASSAPGGPLAGFGLTGANAGTDDAIDSDAALVNGAPCITPAPTGAAGSFIPTYDFGFWKPAALGDRVWIDTDHNGIQDAGEVGVPGVGVTLHDASGATVGHTVTDANGLYLFDGLNAGTYHVCFDLATIPAGYEITPRNSPGSTRANGSDAGTDGCADATALAPGQRDLDWDAGIWKTSTTPTGGSTPSSPPKPRITLKKTSNPKSVRAGNAIHYTLRVTNVSKVAAHDVKVCDTLPDGVTVTGTGGGKLADGVVCWMVGTLGKGSHKSVYLVVKVDLTQRDRIKNTAVATSSDAPRATASSSTNVTAPRARHGVAGVTG